MCEFRRTRSKVWWSTYFQEDDETDEVATHHPSLSRLTTSRYSWRRSLVEDSSRNSSSSPSNGSHKSQDSGFSDSESSSPSSCGSKSDPENRVKSDESCDKCEDESKTDQSPNSPAESALSKLPETPVRISRPHLLRYKKRDRNHDKNEKNLQLVKSRCNSISSYLADCYFPINDFVNEPKTPIESSCSETSQRCTLSRSQTYHSLYSVSESSPDESARTCFIVDELPKRSPQQDVEKTPLGSTDTLSSSSFENEDTVRFLDKKEPSSGRCSPEPRGNEQKDLPCLNVDSLKKLDHNETLDLSLLPDPAHASTPKKDEIRLRTSKKIRSPSPVADEDNK